MRPPGRTFLGVRYVTPKNDAFLDQAVTPNSFKAARSASSPL